MVHNLHPRAPYSYEAGTRVAFLRLWGIEELAVVKLPYLDGEDQTAEESSDGAVLAPHHDEDAASSSSGGL